MMKRAAIPRSGLAAALLAALVLLWVAPSYGTIQGLTGTTFNLVAKEAPILQGDGTSVVGWGYANGAGVMQFPGPTLIVNEGAAITVTLKNQIPGYNQRVSIIFPGQQVAATGGQPGLITNEARPGTSDTVTYTFTASKPGTYMYHSGTNMDIQVPMGLAGALIVRPARGASYAYNQTDTKFHREYLFFLMDQDTNTVQNPIANGKIKLVDTSTHFANNWFINGRNFPDTMQAPGVPWLPNQPYNISPMAHPGEKVLLRLVGAGRDAHPYHIHGNDGRIVAKNGRPLTGAPTAPNGVCDRAYEDYTILVSPGETYDVLWTWTGEALGWDAYGHQPGDPLQVNEYAPDHGKPIPVVLPFRTDLTYGAFYSGSPYLGGMGILPQGSPALNVGGGYFFMWHSHSEKELTTNNIYPGGMITLINVVPWNVPIP